MSAASQDVTCAGLLEGLAAIVGASHVLTDGDSRTFYSTDVLTAAVVPPGRLVLG